MRPNRLLFALLSLLVAATGLHAQDFGGFPVAAPPADAPVTVTLEPSAGSVRPGDQVVLAVVFDHAENWHINLHEPIVPPEMGGFVPSPTTITPDPAEGLSVGRIQWPAPYTAKVDFLFTGTPIDYKVYAGRAVAFIPIRVADDATPGERTVSVRVGFQACDDSVCLQPEVVERSIVITVDPAAEPGSPSELFAGFDPSVFADAGAWGEGALTPVTAAAPKSKFLGLVDLPGPGTLGGVLGLALFAAVGGFVLNLTPCVLPVIPIKVMTISHHAGESRARALTLGLWMAAGVVAFWLGIGVPVAFLATVTDPSIIFGIWWVTLGIGVLILVMGIGIMGLFQITLPQQIYAVNPKADSPHGSFMFGVMTAVLGLPCFGFVAGALLAGAATMPAPVVMVIFGSMGVGMALPYLVLAAMPGLVKKLPKTGPASELVKQVMGLLMIAAACYFIGAGVLALLSGTGKLAGMGWWVKSVHWWAIALAMAIAGGWLLVRTIQITRKPANRGAFSLVALIFVVVGVGAAWNRTDHLRHNFWVDYSAEGLARELDAGRVVVLDFTAEWCLNCKTLEATVLSREPVRGQLLSSGVVPMVADLTSTSAPGWDTLRELGQTGIPLLAVFSPEGGADRPVWMGNAYTPTQVVDAIQRARGGLPQAAAVP